MRLLTWDQDGDLTLTDFGDSSLPPYAVLSHTWGFQFEEVTFQDIREKSYKHKPGYKKIAFCGEEATRAGLRYFWVDTCCIDKANSTELSESILSEYRWFHNASICYVYLSDVLFVDERKSWEISFRQSRWFTRGWTLQELLAPRDLVFYSAQWVRIGAKSELTSLLHMITDIPVTALEGQPLSQFSVNERLGWARNRKTLRVEDKAYCLVGIFGVFMPIIYGEGVNAFHRLMDEIHNKHATHVDTDSVLHKPGERPSYRPLNEAKFRLLTIDPGKMGEIMNGHIKEHSLTSPPSYYALSYVWGQEPSIHRTIIDGRERFIQPNLFHALQRVRLRDGQYSIWVDSLCINQADNLERSMQVGQMATIYSNASGVLIWLGEEDSTSRLALEFMFKITSQDFRWIDLWWKGHGFAALAQVLDRPWFRRGWVLQEAAFSKNSIILCGDQQIHMDSFITAVRTVRDRLVTVPSPASHTLRRLYDSPAITLVDNITSVLKKGVNGSSPRCTMSLENLSMGIHTLKQLTHEIRSMPY